ncbi:ADP-ribosyltransferase [Chryseobacterium sp. T20]|uniref:ADP-ribosyltransferase n=1 Tax=Chryseobacterium sp. T20 TaxID=3395375 RepID=UPI0039BC5938
MNSALIKYVSESLSAELREISTSKRAGYENGLTIHEKAIIYHYTDSGYDSLNERLRNGQDINDFGLFLNYSLDKLPDYQALCYRTIRCPKRDLEKYYSAFKNNGIIIEKSFLSCSKSRLLALQFSDSPVFIILSKRGKDIEKIAKFGVDSGQNEKEIVFKSGSRFKVLDIKEAENKITITLEEV